MMSLDKIYREPLVLLTDLYQLTMAYAYWKEGLSEKEAVFHLFFRKNPFNGGYTIACGLRHACSYLDKFKFDEDSLSYLMELRGSDGDRLFSKDFLAYLREMEFSCSVKALPEGTVAFPQEPLVRVEGPLIQCQLLETPLLNIINFQSLIATKAARICEIAKSEPVLEFGLRRAQGIDGALAASRAAYIGGAAATSNLLAGKLFKIPVKGTHAHSWVMCFDDELNAFRAYSEAMPNNSLFLVDTYDTIRGVKNAIKVGKELRTKGYEFLGIRLDSGDLAYLSKEARRLLDEAGFPDASIVASNDLDEEIIASLKRQGAKIDVWGVGTKLATAYDQPALGGVYKLAALRSPNEAWEAKIKLSEQSIKVSTPWPQQIRRFKSTEYLGDAIFRDDQKAPTDLTIVDPLDPMRRKRFDPSLRYEDLLLPIYEEGDKVYEAPETEEMRSLAKEQLSKFHGGIKRLVNPHSYPVGLEKGLYDDKAKLILKARGFEE